MHGLQEPPGEGSVQSVTWCPLQQSGGGNLGLSCHPLLWPFLGLPWLGWVLTWAAPLQDLHKKYSYIRKTRPDGNCFYRAFGFSHLEALLDDSKELQRYAGGRAGGRAPGLRAVEASL